MDSGHSDIQPLNRFGARQNWHSGWIDNIIDSMTQAGTRHAAHPPGDGAIVSCVQCPALAPHNTSQ